MSEVAGRKPLISVIMPVRNGLPWFRDAVESIVSQTFNDWELLIIDDGSSDGTFELAKSLESEQIRLLPSPGFGLVEALNFGIAAARGLYLARMDADDIAHPERLAKQRDVLDENLCVGLVYTAVRLIDESGRAIGKRAAKTVAPEDLYAVLTARALGRSIIHPTVLMRSEVVRSVGGYRHFLNAEDRDLWLRLFEVTSFAALNEPLLSYRLTATGVSRSGKQRQLASALLASACHEVQTATGIDLYLDRPSILSVLDREAVRLAAVISDQIAAFEKIKSAVRRRDVLQATAETVSLAIRSPSLLLGSGRLALHRRAVVSLADAGERLITYKASVPTVSSPRDNAVRINS